MSGIINNTAARSGVIGTTVGTPVSTDASALSSGTLPMARLSGALPAAVTGGSGLTALGTVATGNLSNTSIVYPAGHVLKVTGETFASSAGNSSTTAVRSKQITCTSGSIIVVCVTCGLAKEGSSGYGTVKISGSSGSGIAETTSGHNIAVSLGYNPSGAYTRFNIAGTVLSSATGVTNPTYSIYYVNDDGSPSWTFVTPTITCFEIKQ
jgi:hypothetical protein